MKAAKGLATADIFVFCTGNLWEGIWGEQEEGKYWKRCKFAQLSSLSKGSPKQDCTGISKWLQSPALEAPAAAPVRGISVSPAGEDPRQTWLYFNPMLQPLQPWLLLLLTPSGRVAGWPLYLSFLHTLTASKLIVDKTGPWHKQQQCLFMQPS